MLMRSLRAAPNALIAACTLVFLLVHGGANRNLAAALGSNGILWQIGIIAACAFCSAWTMIARRPRSLHVLGILHIAAATLMLGYVAAVLLTPVARASGNGYTHHAHPLMAISLTTGLALGSVVIHIIRWLQIEHEEIPILLAVARDTAAKRAV